MNSVTHPLSRRTVLKGAAAGAGTLALAACGPGGYDGPGLYAARVSRVPLDDPDNPAWRGVAPVTVPLGPQNVALPQELAPAVTSVRVRALHDGQRIGFLLEWDDTGDDELTIRVDDFRDACAVLLAPGAGNATLRMMGTTASPATLLHWKADWQRDIDSGRQGLDAVFPNRSVDVYPIVHQLAPSEVTAQSYVEAGATEWLPGVDVGNPVSALTRTSPVEKIIAHGFATTTTAATQDAAGRGVRGERGWQVILSKPLAATDSGEMAVPPGGVATCAFAVWSGQAHGGGSRKAPSVTVHALHLAN